MTEQIKLTVKYAYDIHKNNKYTTFDTRNISPPPGTQLTPQMFYISVMFLHFYLLR